MNEEWRSVPGWPYEVSDAGRVRRATSGQGTRAGRMMNPGVNNCGYRAVTLHHSDRRTRFVQVHHLVAEVFLGAAPGPVGARRGQYQINHKNGNKLDNRPENLEWVTKYENTAHAQRTGLLASGERNHSKLTDADVLAIRARVAAGETQKAIAREFGMGAGHICNIIKRRNWKHLPAKLLGTPIREVTTMTNPEHTEAVTAARRKAS